jgi:hypothetical protein
MGLLTDIKEKVSNNKQEQKGKSLDEEMRNLDVLIEDLFKMDAETTSQMKNSTEE